GAVEQRRREALGIAAVGDLADELVDQVAAMGEDQDAARAGGLDEADRRDGLAGAGGVLEPEAATGAGVVGGRLDDVRVLLLGPVLGLLLLGRLLFLLVGLLVEVRHLGSGPVLRGLVLRCGCGGGAAVAVAGPGMAVEPILDIGDQRGE